jgi:hypothetical protein
MIRMLEPVIYVRYTNLYFRCLQRDRELVKSLIDECKREFKAIATKEGIDEHIGNVELKLEERYSLEERKIGEGIDDKITKG